MADDIRDKRRQYKISNINRSMGKSISQNLDA